ncbi:hypothetical protein [Mangrovicoccus ximenensis]|uniref:hypothetical protein n=1 Tax=Mangrovicoccus ximenensis TaxID=1911570 RepID=UPI000D3D10E5|nr:hypothetical protein [Mangrovicoccus ximenensis]
MPKLKFKIAFAARSDNTPSEGGWTYHHVLPWRYYYLMGYVIANVARLRYLTTDYTIKDDALAAAIKAEKAASGSKTKDEFGDEAADFLREIRESGPALLRLLQPLHGSAAGREPNSIQQSIISAGKFDLGAIGNLCGAPRFGGFLGMAPEHRAADPGDLPERLKPLSADEGWWGLLAVLSETVSGICPAIAGTKAGETKDAALDVKQFRLLLETVRKLTDSHNSKPKKMDAADWYIDNTGHGSRHDWAYLSGIRDAPGAGTCGKIFAIRTGDIPQSGLVVPGAEIEGCRLDYRVFSPSAGDRKHLKFYPRPKG